MWVNHNTVFGTIKKDTEKMSQEVVENDLQTGPENHLHQPHLNTPIITLSPPHSDE